MTTIKSFEDAEIALGELEKRKTEYETRLISINKDILIVKKCIEDNLKSLA